MVPDQVSSLSLDSGSKLRGPFLVDLVLLQSTTEIKTKSSQRSSNIQHTYNFPITFSDKGSLTHNKTFKDEMVQSFSRGKFDASEVKNLRPDLYPSVKREFCPSPSRCLVEAGPHALAVEVEGVGRMPVISAGEYQPPVPHLCGGCGGKIADRYYLLAVDRQWHARCLICCECKAQLDSELTCFARDGNIYCKDDYYRTPTAGSDVVQSGRPIFDDFFLHLWPYIGNNTANVVFQMAKRLWLIRIDQ
ncbi:hypothetical protein TNCV_2820361 [Trichonephila clavipes]|nr:hypothetical protein TNCV_2820361 [Trichonephila clavipes]